MNHTYISFALESGSKVVLYTRFDKEFFSFSQDTITMSDSLYFSICKDLSTQNFPSFSDCSRAILRIYDETANEPVIYTCLDLANEPLVFRKEK